MRRQMPVELQLSGVPMHLEAEQARCPACESDGPEVLGRMGLRLVFRCDRCNVRFFRTREMSPSERRRPAERWPHFG